MVLVAATYAHLSQYIGASMSLLHLRSYITLAYNFPGSTRNTLVIHAVWLAVRRRTQVSL
jgi:hypothetical protein